MYKNKFCQKVICQQSRLKEGCLVWCVCENCEADFVESVQNLIRDDRKRIWIDRCQR